MNLFFFLLVKAKKKKKNVAEGLEWDRKVQREGGGGVREKARERVKRAARDPEGVGTKQSAVYQC